MLTCSGCGPTQALALGADAVMVGRPVLWGLTVGGQEGVRKVTRPALPTSVAWELCCRARVAGLDLTLPAICH